MLLCGVKLSHHLVNIQPFNGDTPQSEMINHIAKTTKTIGKIALIAACFWGTGIEHSQAAVLTLFFEDFESDLSEWTGKGGGSSSGVILDDPKESDKALSFTAVTGAGDIFSLDRFTSESQKLRLSFDYLGLAQPGSRSDDFGGFVGYSYGLPGRHSWLMGTKASYSGIVDHLLDTGSWNNYSVDFTADQPIHLMFEDFGSSGRVTGDVYFDNIRLEAVGVEPPAPVPEPSSILGLLFISSLGFGCVLKRKQK